MQIILNGQTIETQQANLADLLVEQGYEALLVATAFNQHFVAKDQRADTVLIEGCKVEVVAPMQGG